MLAIGRADAQGTRATEHPDVGHPITLEKPFRANMDSRWFGREGIATIDTSEDFLRDHPILVVPLNPEAVQRLQDLLVATVGARAAVDAMAVIGIEAVSS